MTKQEAMKYISVLCDYDGAYIIKDWHERMDYIMLLLDPFDDNDPLPDIVASNIKNMYERIKRTEVKRYFRNKLN